MTWRARAWLIVVTSLLCGMALACGPAPREADPATDGGQGGGSGGARPFICTLINERFYCAYLDELDPEPEP